MGHKQWDGVRTPVSGSSVAVWQCTIHDITCHLFMYVAPGTTRRIEVKNVFPNLFLATPPFLTKNFYCPPTMPSTHNNTIFLGCLKMIKTRMSAKMHFTIKLNLVN